MTRTFGACGVIPLSLWHFAGLLTGTLWPFVVLWSLGFSRTYTMAGPASPAENGSAGFAADGMDGGFAATLVLATFSL